MIKDTYSGPVLASDGLAFGMIALGVGTKTDVLIGVGALGYLLGGPGVHLGYRRPGTAGASLGLRVLLPLATGAIMAGVFQAGSSGGSEHGIGDYSAIIGFAVGGTIGVIAAPIIDAAGLAQSEWLESLPLVPSVSVTANGGSVGLGGAF